MKRKTLNLILVFAVIGLASAELQTGYAGYYETPAKQAEQFADSQLVRDRKDGYTYGRVMEVKLKDGTRCAVFTVGDNRGGGISCDWRHAKAESGK